MSLQPRETRKGAMRGKFTTRKKALDKQRKSKEWMEKMDRIREEIRKRYEAAAAGTLTSTKRRIVELSKLAQDLWCTISQLCIARSNFFKLP